MRVTYYPALDEADEVIGISVAVLDITEDTTLEAPPEEGGGYPAHIPPAATEQWTPQAGGAAIGSIQSSASWVRTLEAIKARARNLGWLEALHPEDLEPTIRAIKNSLKAGTPVDIEYRVEDFEDKWKWLRSRGTPRTGPSGEILRWRGTVEEIHDLKIKADENMSPGLGDVKRRSET